MATAPHAQEMAPSEEGVSVAHVVELFTSQGCSSCLKAETALAELAGRPDVLALAYHVDYWDYIGWEDTYGSAENTARQEAYGESFNLSTLFTPQIIIDGSEQIVGADSQTILEALRTTPPIDRDGDASISARVVGDNLKIKASMAQPVDDGSLPVLIVVTYDERSETQITRGENLGTTIVDTNPVRDWQILGAWSGEPMKISLPLSTLTANANGRNGCAVLIQMMSQTGKPGQILAATRLNLSARN
ncbi:DUF1223 domain-containing protein [Fulvimarina sp. MAC3]|uniref:DUF1223 domain-containing protein n=1 Tax=Fulvimarina sp. MAC3 TaxID=3148887 RepID=UPI0031FD1CD6